MRKAIACAAALMGAAVCQAGTVVGEFSLSNFAFGLVDLDPGDGIHPWLALTFEGGVTAILLKQTLLAPLNVPTGFAPVSFGSTTGARSLSGGISGTLDDGDLRMYSSLSWDSGSTPFGAGTRVTTESPRLGITISPHTGVFLRADLSQSLHQVGGGDLNKNTYVLVSPKIGFLCRDGGAHSCKADYWKSSRTRAFEGDLVLPAGGYMTNTGSSAISGTVVSELETTVSAVPEPGTYELMLAGIGAIGLARRCRSTTRA